MTYRALHVEGFVEGLDEVVILRSAVRALDRPRIFAVEVKEIGTGINDGATTVLAGRSEGATRDRSEYVVGIHGAQDESRAVPTFSAGNASQITPGAFQTPHTDSI